MDKQKESALQGLWEKIEPFLSKNWSSHLQMAGLTLLLLTIQIWQIRGYGRLSLSVFLAGIICLCEASSAAIRFKQDLQRQFQRNTIILLVLEIISMLFLLVNSRDIIEVISIGGEVLLILGLAAAVGAQIVQLRLTEYRWKPGKDAVKECLLLVVLCLAIGFLLNMEIFNTWPRWDSYHYFRAFEIHSVRNIFLPGSDGLIAADHLSASYALWSLLFQSIPIPGMTNLNKLYLSNMAIIAIDLVLFYLIFKQLLPRKRILRHILFAVIAVGAPWIFGCAKDLNAEFVLMTGMLLLLYSVFKNNYMLSILSVFIVCNARETGTLIAASVIGVQLFYDLAGTIKKTKRINLEYYSLCMLLGVSWLMLFRTFNWATAQLKNLEKSTVVLVTLDGSPLRHFGFSPIHIQDVLIATLIVNFKWILSGVILLSLVLFLFQIIKEKRSFISIFSNKECWVIIAALLAYLIENFAYVTYNNYRYYAVSSVLLSILGLCGVSYILEKTHSNSMVCGVVSAVIGVLFWTQSYTTIDPVMIQLYPAMNTGRDIVIALPQHTNLTVDPYFTDRANYNRQPLYFDKALDKAYAAIYEDCGLENTQVLCSDEYLGQPGLGSLFEIWGFGYKYRNPPMWGEWNSEGNYRYLSYEPKNIIDPEYVTGESDLSGFLTKKDHVYYIKMPWGDTVLPALQNKYPNIDFDLCQTIEYRGWVLEIYRIK